MQLSTPKNSNYAAVVVRLGELVPLAGCDNIRGARLFGTQVIVGLDAQPGELGIYFPPECALAAPFLGANNLYRKPEWGNVDPEKRGYFKEHGRVRCVKFRGHRSEGIWLPIDCLSGLLLDNYVQLTAADCLKEGDVFDSIPTGDGEAVICSKYVSKRNPGRGDTSQKGAKRQRPEDSLVDGQFAFHYDTRNLRRNLDALQPSDWISISDKWHGTSVIIGNLLTKRELPWYERLARRLGVKVQQSSYGLVWSSRKVVKGVAGEAKAGTQHYYDSDVWGAWAKVIGERIPPGYTPTGSPIQGGYRYGCAGTDSRLLVYRVTITQSDGTVFEMPWDAMTAWVLRMGLEPVRELYYGKAWGLFPKLDQGIHWHDAFLDCLERAYVCDQDCSANPGMPAEGIVLRIDRGTRCEAFKLKNYRFLQHETKQLDAGVVDIEEEQSDAEASEAKESKV